MPIIFIHGVAVRDDAMSELPRRFGKVPWTEVESNLRTYVAPAISDDPEGVGILRAYWGDLGVKLAWNGRFGVAREKVAAEPIDLRTLASDELGHTLEREVLSRNTTTGDWPEVIEAVWTVARDPETADALAQSLTPEEAETWLAEAIEQQYQAVVEDGDRKERATWWESLGRQMKPAADRAMATRRANIINVLNRIRGPIEGYAPIFLGDVVTYLSTRGDALHPGPIPTRALATLVEARKLQLDRPGEPLVVLSHSMGGQIVYDLITHFLPRMPQYRDLRIDFWCSSGSQVGLFEELKLFLESSPEYGIDATELVPRPDPTHLGYWWNVWDHADLMSFSAKGIIDGVDDLGFSLGKGIQHNHSAYLDTPDFYRTLAAKARIHTTGSRSIVRGRER